MNYPSSWKFDALFSNCSHVFVNFGQWCASWPSHPQSWNRTVYSANVKAYISHLLHLKENYPHVNITWISTNPMPMHKKIFACPLTDWRLSNVISEYNLVTHDVVSRTGGLISYMDTFRIAFPAFDLSVDGTHYQGPVGVALASLFLQSFRSTNIESAGTWGKPNVTAEMYSRESGSQRRSAQKRRKRKGGKKKDKGKRRNGGRGERRSDARPDLS